MGPQNRIKLNLQLQLASDLFYSISQAGKGNTVDMYGYQSEIDSLCQPQSKTAAVKSVAACVCITVFLTSPDLSPDTRTASFFLIFAIFGDSLVYIARLCTGGSRDMLRDNLGEY